MGKELSHDEIIELGEIAKQMLAPNSTFNRVVTKLVGEAVAELTAAPVYDLTARQAHARMKALEDIKQRLANLVNDATMASRKVQK